MTAPFPFYAADFLTGTAAMTCEQVGQYIRLLCYQWEMNGLPSDPESVCNLARCNGNAVADSVASKFELGTDGKLRNKRLENERVKVADMSEKQSAKAVKRWKRPHSDEAKIIADIFRRSHSTEWSDKEIVAFKSIGKIHMEELLLVQKFYKASHSNEKAWLRTGLQAFCNNYRGEVDKARSWAHKNPKTANGSNGNHRDKEPEGFRDWLKETYPKGNQSVIWKDITDSTRKEFQKYEHNKCEKRN